MICCIDDLLEHEVYAKIKHMFDLHKNDFKKYTEHPGRYGFIINDPKLISVFDKTVKSRIIKELQLDEKLNTDLSVSTIYLCLDDVNFQIPYHYDDIYKHISCVLYFGEHFSGTVFLKDFMKKEVIEPKENRLVCFPSQDHLHCVPKGRGDAKRYTLQFHYLTNTS